MSIAWVNSIDGDWNDTNTGTRVSFYMGVGGYPGTVIISAATSIKTPGATVTVTDIKGNAWTVDNGPVQTGDHFVFTASTRQNVGVLLQNDRVTLTFSQPRNSGVAFEAGVYSDVASSGYVDAIANHVSSNTAGPVQTGTVTPAHNGDLIISTMTMLGAYGTNGWTDNAAGTVGNYEQDNYSNTTVAPARMLVQDYQILTLGSGLPQTLYFTMTKPTSMVGLTTAYKSATLAAGASDLILE